MMTPKRIQAVTTVAVVGAAAMFTPLAHAGSVTFEAADVQVLPDYNPFIEGSIAWLQGETTQIWTQGIPFVGTGAPNFLGDTVAENDLDRYFELGKEVCAADLSGSDATCSHQLVSGGNVNFSVAADDNPGLFTGVIAIDRSAPEGFDPLRITGASYSGQDDEFNIDFSAFPALISGDSFAFDLEFSATEVGDYSATLTFQTDTDLEIPYIITGTVTGGSNSGGDSGGGPTTPNVVPTPTAAAAGLLLLGGLATRRRKP